MKLYCSALAFVLMFYGFPSLAQSLCNDRQFVIDFLTDKHREFTVAIGVTNGGGLVEVLTAENGSTWTIIVTSPKGVTCLVAAGEGWKQTEFQSEDPET